MDPAQVLGSSTRPATDPNPAIMSDQDPPAAAAVEQDNAPTTDPSAGPPGSGGSGDGDDDSGGITRRHALVGLSAGVAASAVAATTLTSGGSGGDGGAAQAAEQNRAETYKDLSPAVLDDGPVPIHLWIDWTDSDTHRWASTVAPTVIDLLEAGKARLYHHDYPLPASEMSVPIANSGRAVLDGADMRTFWQYRREMLRSYDPGSFSYETIRTAAKEVGIPDKADALVKVAREGNYNRRLKADQAAIEGYGLTKLPGIAIGADAQFLTPEQAYDLDFIEEAVNARATPSGGAE